MHRTTGDFMARRRLLSVLLPLVAATAAAGVPAASAAATKLIHAGTLLALPGQAPERERTLVIVDDRISEVRDGYADPADFDGEVEVVDLIKITSTGGVLTDRATGTGQQMEMDELREVVRAANRMGRKVASHAHAAEGIIAALEAGVDSVEHGTYVNDDAIALFRETGAYLVPTLLAGATVKQMAEESDFMRPAIREKAVRVGTEMKKNFGNAYRAGVKVAFGTDSGVSRHGDNAQEAVLMVDAGMSEEDVLVAATVNAADLIDMSDDLGTLEKGKYADIVAVDGSPLDDIAELLDVDFVMKGGKVFKTP